MSLYTISTTLTTGITLGANQQYNSPLTITNTGAVFDPSIDILSTSLATVQNAGTVIGGAFAAIDLDAGGTVTNSGTSALISGAPNGGDGVFFLSAAGTVFNEGTIVEGDGSHAGAVVLGQGGYVANNGTAASIIGGDKGAGILIRRAPLTLQNSGTITGGYYGVFGLDGALTASNQGYIQGGHYGIALEAGGYISNTGPAATISGGNDGIGNYYAPFTLINSGNITGGTGIFIDDTTNSTSTIETSGTITGINGTAISVAIGTLDLTLAPEAVITGLVEAAGTGNLLDLAAGSTTGTITGIGTSFTGFDTISIDPGNIWVLSGNAAGLAGGQTIYGFANQDTLDITDGIFTSETFANGTLSLFDNNVSVASILLPDASATSANFLLTSDGGTGTDIIEAPSTIISTTLNAGISLGANQQYNSPLTITNTGAVFDSRSAIDSLSLATVQNAGTVAGSTYAAIDLHDGGTVTNDGTSALIAGADGGNGVGFQSAGTVFNAGTISATPFYSNVAVFLGQGGYVANNGTAARISAGGIGILIEGAPATLQNSGTITGGLDGVLGNSAALTASNQGDIQGIYNAGIQLQAGGSISNTGAAATISGASFGIASYNDPLTLINSGDITGGTGIFIDGNSVIDVSGGTITGTNGVAISVAVGTLDLTLDPGAVITGLVEATGTGNLLDLASSSTTGTITGIGISFTGFDSLALDTGATWSVAGLTSGVYGINVNGFTNADKLDITDLTSTTPQIVTLGSGNVLTADNLDITFAGAPMGDQFTLAPDTRGGTYITSDMPCFAAGTRILGLHGEILVEDIAVGDELVTMREGGQVTQKVIWTGRRAINIRRHPQPDLVRPIRITAGAIAPGVPERDLRLSPEHAIYLEEKLFTAASLVNGTTIYQEQTTTHVTYHHIELETHDILMANGLPCESYLDTGSKKMFENVSGVLVLHPDFSRGAETEFCALLIRDGEALDSLRTRLSRRALTQAA
jgi:hypothetical protein